MTVRIITGDCREVLPTLPEDSFDCVVTSPPYFGLRDYGVDGQIGLEPTLAAYLETMVGVCRELRRVLKPSGTCWLNIGSSYSRDPKKGGSGPNGKHDFIPDYGRARKILADAASGGRNPTPSRQRERVQACGSDDKGQQSSLAPDLPCSGLDDGRLDGFPTHRGHIPRSGQPLEQSSPRDGQTNQDSERLDCEREDDQSFRLPIGLSSLRNALGASYREATALACPQRLPRYSCDEPQKTERVFDKKMMSSISASRTLGMDASAMACGCNSCGICFVYLATRCLKFKAKDLILVPDLLALALQADGWFLRSEIVWSKPSPMPESVRDRPTCAHEKVWLLTKSERYFYDAGAIAEQADQPLGDAVLTSQHKQGDMSRNLRRSTLGTNQGKATRNARNVWTISSTPFSGSHYAVMPSTLAERCIKAGSPLGGSVLDPFFGAGTTGLVADRLGRHCTGIELNPANRDLGAERVRMDGPLFAEVSA